MTKNFKGKSDPIVKGGKVFMTLSYELKMLFIFKLTFYSAFPLFHSPKNCNRK